MINETVVTQETVCGPFYKRICWSAMFVGALVAVGLSFLLNLFSLAIGLSAFTMNSTGARVVAIGGMIGLLVGVVASMLAAGYTAGYFGRYYSPLRNHGVVYGFGTWVIALILGAALAGPLGAYVAGVSDNVVPTVNTPVDNSAKTEKPAVQATTTTTNPEKTTPNKETVHVKTTPEAVIWSVFSVFILFFIGALSCCLGGIWGMSCTRED